MARRVGVVMGGASGEREVSLATGKAVCRALEENGHVVVPIVLGCDPDWAFLFQQARIDVAFLALHGRLGEDGCVQGLCEVLRIPYTGSGVLASALAMDKVKAKELFHQHNVPTPPYYTVGCDDGVADLAEIHGSFGFPVIVKPCHEGSSLGLAKASSLPELAAAVDRVRCLDNVVLVERYIRGREVCVGLLNGRVLGTVEVSPKNGIYDYESKYTPGMCEYHVPARMAPTRCAGILNLGERAARALGCCGPCRVDLLVTEGENEYVLEVNTLPGMTPSSLLPKIAASAGFSFAQLCEEILCSARLHSAPYSRVGEDVSEPQSRRTETVDDACACPFPLAEAV